jgi:hypothetical protein
MPDAKSRARVERFVRGEFRPDDFTELFLFARDHCDHRVTVKDIGDFVAHHFERDRGIITNATREWFTVARFCVPLFTGKFFDPHRMPPVTKDYFEIAVNRIDKKTIRDKTGLHRLNAYRIMQGITARLNQNLDGTWSLPSDLSTIEGKLIQCVSSTMVVRPAFDANRLCNDFISTLKSNGLITKEEISKRGEDLRTIVQLYAVSRMHNRFVQIGDGTSTQLKAKPQLKGKSIVVNAEVPNTFSSPRVLIATSMFTANLDPAIHCHEDLIALRDWNLEIELAPDKRLSPLR